MAIQYLYYAGQGPLQWDDATAYDDLVPMEASRAPQHYIEDEPSALYHVVRLSGLTSKLTSMGTSHGGSTSAAMSVASHALTDAGTADSKAVSTQSYASSADSSVLLALSGVDSSSTSAASVADSKAVSAQAYAQSADTSAVTQLSGVDSQAASVETSRDTSSNTAVSTADSKGVSAQAYANSADASILLALSSVDSANASSVTIADSKAVSAQAYASSADASVLSVVSTADSKAVSAQAYASSADSSVVLLVSTADSKAESASTRASTADSKAVSCGSKYTFTELEVGDGSNNLDVATTGLVTMTGTAQGSLKLRPVMMLTEAGRANVPTEVIIGTSVGYSFDIWAAAPPPLPDEELYMKIYVPNRWNAAEDPQIGVLVTTSGAEDIGDKFKFQLSWCTTLQGSGTDTVNSTVTSTTSEITIKDGGTAAYSAYDMWFTLDASDADNPIAPGSMLTCRLRRVAASANEVTAEPVVWDWVTHWRTNKMYGSWAVETNG